MLGRNAPQANHPRYRDQAHPHGSSAGDITPICLEKQVVPRVGLEPTLLSELDFESSASTNSTTGARLGGQFLNGLDRECNRIFCNFLQVMVAKLRAPHATGGQT